MAKNSDAPLEEDYGDLLESIGLPRDYRPDPIVAFPTESSPAPDLSGFPALDNDDPKLADAEIHQIVRVLGDYYEQRRDCFDELEGKEIGDNGVIILCHAIDKYPDILIRTLDLRNCGIGNKGALALAVLLARYKKIENILLDGNAIGEKGAAALEEGILGYLSIHQLSLSNQAPAKGINPVTSGTLQSIRSLLDCNTNYREALFKTVDLALENANRVATDGLLSIGGLPAEIIEHIVADYLKSHWVESGKNLDEHSKILLEGYARDMCEFWADRKEYIRSEGAERLVDSLTLANQSSTKSWSKEVRDEREQPKNKTAFIG